jgi:hypothetical protein
VYTISGTQSHLMIGPLEAERASSMGPASACLRCLALQPDVEGSPCLVNVGEFVRDDLELLLQLVRGWALPQLDCFDKRMGKAATEEMDCVHLDMRISHRNEVRYSLKLELVLHLQEGMHLPRMAVARELRFECTTGRNDLNLPSRRRAIASNDMVVTRMPQGKESWLGGRVLHSSKRTFSRSSARPGMQSVEECCTHPSDAFVMMYVFPAAHADCRSCLTMRSNEASCSRTCEGIAPYCRCTISR